MPTVTLLLCWSLILPQLYSTLLLPSSEGRLWDPPLRLSCCLMAFPLHFLLGLHGVFVELTLRFLLGPLYNFLGSFAHFLECLIACVLIRSLGSSMLICVGLCCGIVSSFWIFPTLALRTSYIYVILCCIWLHTSAFGELSGNHWFGGQQVSLGTPVYYVQDRHSVSLRFLPFFLHYFLTLFHVFCEGFLLWSVELKLNLLCTHFWVFYRLICRLLIQVSWTAVSFLVDLALFCTLIFGWLFISFVSGLHTVLNESLDYSFGWLQGALLSTSSGNLRWRVQLPLCGLLVPSLVHL